MAPTVPTPDPASETTMAAPIPDESLDAAASNADAIAGPGDVGSPVSRCPAGASASTHKPHNNPAKAHIAVHAQDALGNPVKGVKVGVSSKNWTGTTDTSGNFDFGEVPPDTYTANGQIQKSPVQAVDTKLAPQSTKTIYKLIFCIIKLEIQINNTPATNDDIVQLKCSHPAHRHKVSCRIRLVSGAVKDHQILLTNPDGRLRFPEAADTTKTLTLPASGAWVAFEISGELGSVAKNDAKIEVKLPGACPDGGSSDAADVKGSKNVTVFWFDPSKILLKQGGNYKLTPANKYTVVGGHAITYAASATVKPAGVDCSAPQLKDLRIGIMQESSNFASITTWAVPTLAWLPGVASGTTADIPVTIAKTTTYNHASVTEPVADTDSSSKPLYDRPGIPTQLDPNSLKPPKGCAGGAPATSFDTPSQGAPTTFTQPVQVAGVTVGNASWSRVKTVRQENFRTFCVVFNTSTSIFCALREALWDLNADSSGPPADQHAHVHVDGPATANPATGIDANSAPTSVVVASPVGVPTSRFVKP
jgi:hypothetical protein